MTALVLSSGGMFGAWQAGVWSELEPVLKPDMVVGASVGSLNGWLIAAGAPASELVRQWREAGGYSRIRWRVPPSPLGGVITPDGLENHLRRITAEYTPRLPFGVVASRLPRLRPTLFQHDLTWRHLAASCAVPVLLPAHRLNGRGHVDGGLLGPVPLWAAKQMGAKRAVALNALHPVPKPIRGIYRALRLFAQANPEEAEGLEVVETGPPSRLGKPEDIARWKRENVERWIESGCEAGRHLAKRLF